MAARDAVLNTIASNNMRAMGLMVAAGLFFAISHATIRHVTQDLHPLEAVFFRNLYALLFLTPMFWRSRRNGFRTQHLKLHLSRGVLQCVAVMGMFTGLSLIPLAEATALSFTSPLFVAVGATLVFREAAPLRRWLAIGAGFAGMLMIIRPGFAEISIGAWFMIGSAVLFAVTKMMAKSLSRTDSSTEIVAYVSFVMTPLALAAALFVWRWPTLDEMFWLTVIGVVSTAAQVLLVQAYRHADMTVVEPLSFARLLWATVLGFLIFAELPDPWIWAGALVIFVAGISLARGESRP